MSLPKQLLHLVQQAHKLNPSINAFTQLASLQEATTAYSSLPPATPLHGYPIALKDAFCTLEPFKTTAASRTLRDYTSPLEATVVRRLREAGALIVGKTNMDEFGMGSANTNSYFGPVINPSGPLTPDESPRVAGGSSGGSAAAVAAGLCRIALGTDTGGSTRLPASFCGVFGLKPSYGLLSRWGLIAYASSLDTVGIMAKEVEDVRKTFDVLSAYDKKDPTSVLPAVRDRIATQSTSLSSDWSSTNLKGLRIGIPIEYFPTDLSPHVLPSFRLALQTLREKGAILSSVSLPSTPLALGAYYVIASAEASSNLARFDGARFGARVDPPPRKEGDDPASRPALYSTSRSAGFGAEVRKRILLGTYALSAEAFDNYFLQAQRVRSLLRNDFASTFRTPSPLLSSPPVSPSKGIDVLLYPSSISTAPLLDPTSSSSTSKGTEAYTQDLLNVPASLAGLPAMSVPMGKAEDGWPVGVQVAGQWGSDGLVMLVGEALSR